jgi:hypothetical protein
LGIIASCQLNLILENSRLRVEVKQNYQLARPENGYELLICKESGERHLADF